MFDVAAKVSYQGGLPIFVSVSPCCCWEGWQVCFVFFDLHVPRHTCHLMLRSSLSQVTWHSILIHLDATLLQAIDKVVPFLKKCLYLVASKLSLEVVPFWKTQANSGDHSATMFLSVFVFFLAFSLGLGI